MNVIMQVDGRDVEMPIVARLRCFLANTSHGYFSVSDLVEEILKEENGARLIRDLVPHTVRWPVRLSRGVPALDLTGAIARRDIVGDVKRARPLAQYIHRERGIRVSERCAASIAVVAAWSLQIGARPKLRLIRGGAGKQEAGS